MPAVPALQIVMEREQGNPEFAFLFDTRCPEHAYYRWRLFSLASGDTLRR
jgi:U2-associated protein SR140